MLSKNQIKYINQLKQKKYRAQENVFVAEGLKSVKELLNSSLELIHIYSTKPWHTSLLEAEFSLISESDLKKISSLKTPNQCLAVFKMKAPKTPSNEGLIIALDDVRDPGNLGTIIRLCDWFGVSDLICNEKTVDLYNPKVVQATMGSLDRVNVYYTDLKAYITSYPYSVFGTFMDGENIYNQTLPKNGLLIMGNEANGISKEIEALIHKKVSIPRFGNLQLTESLNVATATAIFLSEFKRNS